MEKILLSFCTGLVLLALFCELPEDPSKDPSNASAIFTTINNAEPASLNEVIAGATVTIGYNLHLPDFVDSVKLTILSSQQAVERTYIIKALWEAENLSTPVIFPSAGTKTCVLTCFRSNGTTSDAKLIFVVAYQPGNRSPKWSPDTVELASQKGSPETRNLMPYAKDPDGNPITFDITLPNPQFTVQDSHVTVGTSLEASNYYFRVIISDGELQDTGIVAWKIFAPQTVHAVLNDDSAKTVIDNQITIDVLANDILASGVLLLSSVTQPANGLVAIKSNKTIYIPTSGFSGTDTFNYIVNGLDTGKVKISVSATATTHPPQITIAGDKTLQPLQTCLLVIESSDEDIDQTLHVMLKETLDGASIIGDSLFTWVIPADFIGEKILTFKVTDNGTPPLSDSIQVIISVSNQTVNNAPHWNSKTLIANLNDTGTYILQLPTICRDNDGDQITYYASSNTLPGDTILGSSYTFKATPAVIGEHTVQIIASDPLGAKDTLTINIKVTASSVNDNTPPAMRLVNPQRDSATVNATSAAISIEATDASGIVSVTASFGPTDLSVSSAKPLYSVTVANLTTNQLTTVRFIATDSSGNGNRDTLFVTIKYDPSISDATGPVFKQISGPVSGSIITNPLVTIVDSITDPSGIDSIFWSLNGGPIKMLTAISGKPDQFSLTATVERENLDTIIITAVDKSAKRNRSTRMVVLKYVVAPVITIQPEAIAAVVEGQALKLSVTATGTPVLKYQWYKNDVLLSGENTFELNKAQAIATDAGTYHVVVSNGSGIDILSSKSAVTIKITAKITEEPQSKEANEGGNATFTVKAEGDTPILYLWLKDDTIITGANAATYTLSSITKADDKRSFRCVVNNSFSRDTSVAAVLTVITIPIYNVSFAVDGGTVVPDQSIKQGAKSTMPATNPTKEGFVFGGWYTDPAFSTVFDFSTQTITANRIIFAKWIKTYTLTIVNFPTVGGSVSKSPNTIVYASGASVSITAIANSGYRFKNWTGDHSGSTNPAQITMTKDYTITANFLRQYTVNFSAAPSERGNITTPATSSVVVDSGVALDIAATPAAGFKFKRWTSLNAGVSFVSSTSAGTRLNVTQDVSGVGVQAVFGCITFRKDFQDKLHSVAQGDDGSYGVLCEQGSNGVVIKLNTAGEIVWEKTVCNLGFEQAGLIPISRMKNGFLTGAKSSDTTFCKIIGVSSDASTTPLFTVNPVSDLSINFWWDNALQTNDNGYFFSGYNVDLVITSVIKTNASRQKVWTMNLDSLSTIRACRQSKDNGFILVDGNGWVVNINSTGTAINFATKIPNVYIYSICPINEINGYIGGGESVGEACLIKILPNGTIVSGWPKTFRNFGTIVSVHTLSDGTFVYITNNGNFVKTDVNGNILWNKKFSSDNNMYNFYLELTNDGGFIISNNYSKWVIKTDENGDTD